MENTLLAGDFLLVNKAVYGAQIPATALRLMALREPKRRDVVVFNPPHDLERNYVKRLIGLPRDTLEMRDKQLYVNGELLYEPYVRHEEGVSDSVHPDMRWQRSHLIASTSHKYRPTRDNWGPLVVPSGQYFVLGDNRENSEDSRYWGFVERAQIRGQPWLVYYSFVPSSTVSFSGLRSVRWARLGTLID